MLKCKLCLKSYSSKSSKNRHVKEVHGPKKFCQYCSKSYPRINQHLLYCKKYHRYQLNKVKIIGGEMFFINSPKEDNPRHKTESDQNKCIEMIEANQIDQTDYNLFSHKKIGEGAFCNVYFGKNIKTGEECAIKYFKKGISNIKSFDVEKSILENLAGNVGFPSLFYSNSKDLMIIESIHGPNLKNLFSFCDNKFPLRTTCLIGIEMISRIQDFHSKGYIHRDIKPSNFSWGKFTGNNNELNEHIILIDYDLAGIYKKKMENIFLFSKKKKNNLQFIF